jgi:hypothetical protein
VAVSSLLNPSSIVRERRTTAEAAQNFITGGSPLGQGVVASAANKIVGFQRGAAAVAPKPPDLNSIIQTLSSNILNNVENRVQSINQNVTQIVDKRIGKLERDYGERLDKIDATKPNAILQNFLNLYKQALEYIQFLGDRRNVKTLGDNLKALQNVFTETFNVAKIIRQTIVKIVKQLSNLPTATAGGGGLNLDIDIPGGNLRRGPLSNISRMLKGGLVLGGAAVAGGLGSKVVSGMLDLGGDVQPAPTTEGAIPTSLLDVFSGILDRFGLAIRSLASKRPSTPQSGPSVSGPSTIPKEPPKPGGGGGGAGVNAGDVMADTPEERAFIATVRETEGTAGAQGYNTFFGGSQYGGDLSGKTVLEVKQLQEKFLDEGKGRFYDKGQGKYRSSAAVGAGQFLYPEQVVRDMGMDPAKVKFTPELQNQMILYLAKKKRGVDVSKQLTAADFKVLQKEWAGLGEYYGQGGSLGRTSKLYTENLKEARSGAKPTVSATPAPKSEPKVTPSSTAAATQQQVAQTVSRPPVQQKTQVNIAPLNVAGPQAQSTKSGDSVAPPPVMNKGGVTVPFLTSSNHDNFLTLYSKMVYNIVDG